MIVGKSRDGEHLFGQRDQLMLGCNTFVIVALR